MTQYFIGSVHKPGSAREFGPHARWSLMTVDHDEALRTIEWLEKRGEVVAVALYQNDGPDIAYGSSKAFFAAVENDALELLITRIRPHRACGEGSSTRGIHSELWRDGTRGEMEDIGDHPSSHLK